MAVSGLSGGAPVISRGIRRRCKPQEKKNTCAVACLRAILALQFDVEVREAALEALGTSARVPIALHGVDNAALRRMVTGASYAYNPGRAWRLTCRNHGTLDELARHVARGHYPLVTVWVSHPDVPRGFELHAIVVLEIHATTDAITVFDPAYRRLRRFTRAQFQTWWTLEDGRTEYAVVTGGELLPEGPSA